MERREKMRHVRKHILRETQEVFALRFVREDGKRFTRDDIANRERGLVDITDAVFREIEELERQEELNVLNLISDFPSLKRLIQLLNDSYYSAALELIKELDKEIQAKMTEQSPPSKVKTKDRQSH